MNETHSQILPESLISSKTIDILMDSGCLSFGDFTLKSGKRSPFFLNMGQIYYAQALKKLAALFAHKIVSLNLSYDALFGSSYKGIPLVASVAIELSSLTNTDVPFCYNRKEIKSHGEQGIFVGYPPKGKILILDDVLTKGTAIKESIGLLSNTEASISGVIVAVDRQESGGASVNVDNSLNERHTSIKELLSKELATPIHNLTNLSDIAQHLTDSNSPESLKKAHILRNALLEQ